MKHLSGEQTGPEPWSSQVCACRASPAGGRTAHRRTAFSPSAFMAFPFSSPTGKCWGCSGSIIRSLGKLKVTGLFGYVLKWAQLFPWDDWNFSAGPQPQQLGASKWTVALTLQAGAGLLPVISGHSTGATLTRPLGRTQRACSFSLWPVSMKLHATLPPKL